MPELTDNASIKNPPDKSSLDESSPGRYNGVAIGLHWIIALLIIGLLAMGKFMTSLEEADPLRFSLTQWHKSFGITILVLSLMRVLWRLTHRPPALPSGIRSWEKVASRLTHFLLYFLILALPVSGWVMVSASPLNLSTILFNIIPFPHLPPFASLANKAQIAEISHQVHEISSGILIVLLLMHIGAAMMHRFIHKDTVMTRMSLDFNSPRTKDGLGLLAGSVAAILLGLLLVNSIQNHQHTHTSGQNPAVSSNVNFALVLMGGDIQGSFADSTVQFDLNTDKPSASRLTATVQTASANTTDPQINNSLPGPDWFDTENHPTAIFVSTSIEQIDQQSWKVVGDLTIRETTRPVNFTLNTDNTGAKGAFTINRLDYEIGLVEQPDDSIAGFNVIIEFDFPLE